MGERYILGGENLALREILAVIAGTVGRRPPKVSLPHDLILPFAYMAEMWARRVSGKEPFATVDGLNQARKRMFFSHAKAARELGYNPRPASEALKDAVAWFKQHGYVR